jgi:nucleoside-diphosphate-sugar epimerase
VGYPICKKFPKEARATNLEGSILLNKIRGETPLLFGSTGSNYGVVTDKVCTEETPLNPVTLYGETKTLAEAAFRKAGNIVCYRFATAFGVAPRLRLDLLVNDFCYRAVRLKSLIVYEAGFKRTFIHVRDIGKSFIFAIDNYGRMKNEIYNVGSDSMNYTKAEIAEKIKTKTDYYMHFADVGKDEDQRNYEVSYEKISRLGFQTTIDLDRGLDELIEVMQAIDIQNPYSNV